MTKFVNRAKMNVSSSGTGTMTLSTAVDRHQSFIDAGVTNGETVRYVLEEGVNWEIGTGVFDSAAGTLTRIVSESSNADALITLAGEATVFVTAGGEDLFAVANNLSDLANAATARTNLGLVIGTDVQGYDATLLNDADIGVTVQAYNAAIPTSKATTAQAEAGTDDATYMTPLKTNEAVAATTDIVRLTGAQTLVNKTIQNQLVVNYTEQVHYKTGGLTIQLQNGTIQIITTSGANNITLPTSVAGKSFIVIIKFAGAHSPNLLGGGSTLKWAGGDAPVMTAVNGKFDIFSFFQDGVNTYGSIIGQNF